MDKIISVSGGVVWRRLVSPAREWIGSGGSRRSMRVGLVGAGSATGRPLGLMLRVEPGVSSLTAIEDGPDAAAALEDLAHIPGTGTLRTHARLDRLHTMLADTDLVLISGGLAPHPSIPPDVLLRSNLTYVKSVMCQVMRIIPMPLIGLVTEPLNTIYPAATEWTKARSLNDPKKLFGVATVNALRAKALFAKFYGLNPELCKVPVLGGCSGATIVPIFSHAKPPFKRDEKSVKELTNELRHMDDHIVKDKHGNPSNLSSAFAALAFTRAIKTVFDYNQPVQVTAMVENNDLGTNYLTGLVQVDRQGAGAMERYKNLTPFECDMLELSLRQLRTDIESANNLPTLIKY